MAEKIFEYHASDIVDLDCEDFHGPIAKLYELITHDERYGGKYSIKTFPLHLVTNRFVEYLATLERFNSEIAADFLPLATFLLKLKAISLVTPPILDDDEDLDDIRNTEEILRRKLEIYEIVKRNQDSLKEREKLYRINRKPLYTDADAIIVIDRFNMDDLIDACGQVLFRMAEKDVATKIKKIPKDKYPVQDQMGRVFQVMLKKKRVGFYGLFDSKKPEKAEIISTFQAVLELMHKQVVLADQEGNEEIQITLNPELEGRDVDFNSLIAGKSEDINGKIS